ncbi:MAG TPA: gluconate 2-dehydrogenase subunit 3 family protein [Bryobacteraceae bacterium]|nr:gluconate 2-dehydrogenase subunit 3 family protein [Bryobacteraceae bacterium]
MIDRRELFRIIGATLAATREGTAQHVHRASAAAIDVASYRPRFFSEQQYRVIDELTEIIIPTDEQSPGAHAAGVRFYIDTVLHYSAPDVQQHWRDGLAAVEDAAREQFGKGFADCGAADKERVVALMARAETGAPQPRIARGQATQEKDSSTELERFFPVLKQMSLDAFALSEIGMKEYLGYKGNTALQEFPGCAHPEHQRI